MRFQFWHVSFGTEISVFISCFVDNGPRIRAGQVGSCFGQSGPLAVVEIMTICIPKNSQRMSLIIQLVIAH